MAHAAESLDRLVSGERPVSLPLPSLFAAMPITAVASIAHRIAGVALFFGGLFLCYLLDVALDGPAGFERASAIVGEPLGKLALWLLMVAFAFHLFAGVKHLLLDFHVGDGMGSARFGAWVCIVLTLLTAVAGGVWLW